MPKSATDTSLKITLRISETLYDTFAERAAKKGWNPETEIVRHLGATSSYTATQGIYLNDDQRNELSTLAGRTFMTPENLLDWAHKVATLDIGEIRIEMPLTLVGRLATRRFGREWKEYLKATVLECLEEKVGLR